MSENKSVKFQIKIQTVAEKTAKNFRGLLYFAAPCRTLNIRNSMLEVKPTNQHSDKNTLLTSKKPRVTSRF